MDDLEKLLEKDASAEFKKGVEEGINLIEYMYETDEEDRGLFRFIGEIPEEMKILPLNDENFLEMILKEVVTPIITINGDEETRKNIEDLNRREEKNTADFIKRANVDSIFNSIDRLLDYIYEESTELQEMPENANDEFHLGINYVYEYVYAVYKELEKIRDKYILN